MGNDLLSLEALEWLNSVNYSKYDHEDRMKLIDAARVLYPSKPDEDEAERFFKLA